MGEEETGAISAEQQMRMKRKEKKQRFKKNRKVEKRRDARRMKIPDGAGKKRNMSDKMKRLFRKRAREYNSDDDDDDDSEGGGDGNGGEDVKRRSDSEGEEDMEVERDERRRKSEAGAGVGSDGEDSDGEEEGEGEDHEGHRGVMRFVEGIEKFKVAFQKIMKSHVDDGTLGPVLAAKKKLVVAKLAEEDVERKAKGAAKKEKLKIEEIGHIKPANFLDTHEKFLIGVATKGVVKLFNAVNKAQNAEKGLDPSRFRDAKVLTKRRKEAFRSELNKSFTQSTDGTSKSSAEDSSQPAWAPLRDSYMLTNSRLKNWDKMEGQVESI